jgi:hypothetical protein
VKFTLVDASRQQLISRILQLQEGLCLSGENSIEAQTAIHGFLVESQRTVVLSSSTNPTRLLAVDYPTSNWVSSCAAEMGRSIERFCA